ncbi:MAG: sulfur carrier protein ThiS [Nocardioides sp.]
MLVTVNGVPRAISPGTTVAALTGDATGRAVAVNGTVVRSRDWLTTELHEHDRVEVVTAHQGG